MRVLFATSEAHPLVKTGGLADVSGALPQALRELDIDVRIVMPAYRSALSRCRQTTPLAELTLEGGDEPVRILGTKLPDSSVPVYLIDSPRHFDRPGGPYSTPDGVDWPDNGERFTLFNRAVTAIANDQARLQWRPDLVHCNDWQAGLTPALLAQQVERPATVFTVHNLAYQGLFPWDNFQRLKLPYDLWSMDAMEFYGQFSMIKGGLAFADHLTTVSPTYAEEICTPEFGAGLDGLLRARRRRLTGILNGVDYSIWDPSVDPHIAWHYSAKNLEDKSFNRGPMLAGFGLEEQPGVAVIGMVGRMVEQKGIDLVLGVLDRLLRLPVQLAILGSGQKEYETALRGAAKNYPNLGLYLGYDEPLAHLVEAGAHMFLMPSRFEPCGLNQLYSMRYGTIPVVRRTGGLADTVVDADPRSLEQGRATGFVFEEDSPDALYAALRRALTLFQDTRQWQALMRTGMARDHSWRKSAERYVTLYRDTLAEAGKSPDA